MDLDAHRRRSFQGTCFKCHKRGHRQNECPDNLQLRVADLLAEVEALKTQKTAVQAKPSTPVSDFLSNQQ
jgi:cytochrome c553